MKNDNHELAILEPKDDSMVTHSKTIQRSTTFELSDVTMSGLSISIDGAADSSGDLSWQRP